MTSSGLARTPLHAEHVSANAKMVPYAGFEMPVHYPTGITAEHHAVRHDAGLFDVSHMGEIEVLGRGALDLVQYLCSNDATDLAVGQAQYSTLPREDGGLLDDLIVYRLADRYLLVVNAANRAKDYAWIAGHASRFDVEVIDRSDDIALLALQGPKASEILARLTPVDLDTIRYFHFTHGDVADRRAIVSRTGYTGEDGFELYLDAADAVHVWRAILAAGADRGVVPVGLGARDTLRLEMGYPLYGNDLDESRTAIEAGLGWVTRLDKPEFIARDALRERKASGPSERLTGFRLLERGFPRPGYEIVHGGERVGVVTSGTLSPSLGIGVGMAYLPVPLAKPGTALEVIIRGQAVPAEVARPPFYTAGSLRR